MDDQEGQLIQMERYLDARESDSWGGVGPDHQGNEGWPQVSKHVGELKEDNRLDEGTKTYNA